jgi:soluble lytic murein transglycosylase-like protein
MRLKALFLVLVLALAAPTLAHAFCFEEAAKEYHIAPVILWAIAKKESNFNAHALNVNKNGSYDYGHMQINSYWYPFIGHENWMALSDPCYASRIAAWILFQCIERHGYTWEAIGCYHSPDKDRAGRYAEDIERMIRNSK